MKHIINWTDFKKIFFFDEPKLLLQQYCMSDGIFGVDGKVGKALTG
jgi:hypothetical protein